MDAPIPKGSPGTLKAIALMIPNSIGGQFSQLPSKRPFGLARIQMAMQNTATIEYYDATGPNGENVVSEDPLVAISFSHGKIMMAGEKKYCAVINFNEFGY